MGLLSSAWKSIKGGFKKIGKTVKKGFKKFGKLMGKFGILGQLAMSFILPGIGGMFVKGLGSMLGVGSNITSLSTLAANLGASANPLAKIAGHAIEYASIPARAVTAPFKAVTSLMTNSLKFAANKIQEYVPSIGNIFTPKGGYEYTLGSDLSKIGEGLKTTRFNTIKANRIKLDKLMAEGADIGKGSYAIEEGYFDTNAAGETIETLSTEAIPGADPKRVGIRSFDDKGLPTDNIEALKYPTAEYKTTETYRGSRFDDASGFREDLFDFKNKGLASEAADQASDFSLLKPSTWLGKAGETGSNIKTNIGKNIEEIPGTMVSKVATTALSDAVGLGGAGSYRSRGTDFGANTNIGITSPTAQRAQDVALQRLYSNPEPTGLINSHAPPEFNSIPGWIPNESSAYHNTLRSLTRTA